MRRISFLSFFIGLLPVGVFAATDFRTAAQLMTAAKSANIQKVQYLINSGADVNYVDNTGLSLVCTAIMNNDTRAAQILQMYGADSSKCDKQIKAYKTKSQTGETGFFSGLSSTQTLALSGVAVAGAVGGVLLLTDVFDSDNDNDKSVSTGSHTGSGGSGSSTTVGEMWDMGELPYGPLLTSPTAESANYNSNLNVYSDVSSTSSVLKTNYLYMNANNNYLLLMHGYSSFARGYFGMTTLRNATTKVPLSISGYNFGSSAVGGGSPINIALITANGIYADNVGSNVTTSVSGSSLQDTWLLWTTKNGDNAVSAASNDMLSSKYYNNLVTLDDDATSVFDNTSVEDTGLLTTVDLSNSGTVIKNSYATTEDNKLVKIVGGRIENPTEDYGGFAPNAQLTIFRTGNGSVFVNEETPSVVGTYSVTTAGTFASGDTLTINSNPLTVDTVSGTSFALKDTSNNTYNAYIGTDGWLYILPVTGSVISGGAYSFSNTNTSGNLTLQKTLSSNSDYYNYKAMKNALSLRNSSANSAQGRSSISVLANVNIIEPLHATSVKTIDDLLSGVTVDQTSYLTSLQNNFYSYIDSYYNVNTTDGVSLTDDLPSADAVDMLNAFRTQQYSMLMFSTGASLTDSLYSGAPLKATFENAVPILYPSTEHLFMSVVAVGLNNGGTTSVTSDISGYSPTASQKYQLAQWHDTTNGNYYRARVCGISGSGTLSLDPWCFAAIGNTDAEAVSAMAGAVGVVQSAFPYMTNKQIFSLLALTAEGPYLGSATAGTAITRDELISYLQSKYVLPNNYQYRVTHLGEDYLDVFKEVYGYGLINLERATTPETAIYYYDTNGNIVSTSGTAYWRVATNTTVRSSGVLNPRVAGLSLQYYDLLQSADGEISLPRIWDDSVSLQQTNNPGLSLSELFADLKTRESDTSIKMGNLDFSMAISEREYVDNMSGLDNMHLVYHLGNWDVDAGYQHNLTNGHSKFNGMANPVLALTSDALTFGGKYKFNNWTLGMHAFSGSITEEGLLENDPAISNLYMPAKLGFVNGAEAGFGWANDTVSITNNIGFVNESDTLLGAYSSGMFDFGNGKTSYIDTVAKLNFADKISLTLRSSFAKTVADNSYGLISDISDIYSDAFAVGMNFGNFDISVSQPLSVFDGSLSYAYANYSVVEDDLGRYSIVADTKKQDVSLVPEKRELRFGASYRYNFGNWTDGAVGFMYRMNPDNLDNVDDEAILMLKLSHRVGI